MCVCVYMYIYICIYAYTLTPTRTAFTVTEFARMTGDLRSVSSVDLKLLALTYMLHVERCGHVGIRTEPLHTLSSVVGTRGTVHHGWYEREPCRSGAACTFPHCRFAHPAGLAADAEGQPQSGNGGDVIGEVIGEPGVVDEGDDDASREAWTKPKSGGRAPARVDPQTLARLQAEARALESDNVADTEGVNDGQRIVTAHHAGAGEQPTQGDGTSAIIDDDDEEQEEEEEEDGEDGDAMYALAAAVAATDDPFAPRSLVHDDDGDDADVDDGITDDASSAIGETARAMARGWAPGAEGEDDDGAWITPANVRQVGGDATNQWITSAWITAWWVRGRW